MNKANLNGIFFLIAVIAGIVLFTSLVAASPAGATLTPLGNQTAPSGTAGSISAYAGNVTEVSITGKSTTQAWQGYYGNVSGVIQLADGSNKVMYNWSALAPTGEVYASLNSSVMWANIQCFNFTADGTMVGNSIDNGMNISQANTLFGIGSTDVDSIDRTFNANNHAAFYTSNVQFTANLCPSTKIYNSAGVGAFDEALLYSPGSKGIVYTSIIADNGDGFDAATHDFEMLVPENGHGTDTAVTPYYFYIELG